MAMIFNLNPTYLIWIVIIYTAIHFCLGFFAGWFSYSLSLRVSQEVPELPHQQGNDR